MSISKDTVKQVAHLARISLNDDEVEHLSLQLKDIIDFIDTLKTVDIANVSPTSHILPVHNVMREDTPVVSIPVEKALENAPSRKGNYFGVPKVI